MIDFDSPEKLADFVRRLRESHDLPHDVGAYTVTALDFSAKTGGVPRGETYLVTRDGEAEGRERLIVRTEAAV